MAIQSRASSPTVALWILAILASLWFLRSARALLVPIALGVLISYALEPIVLWLERRHIPRWIGAALVMALVLASCAAGVYALRDDIVQVVQTAPQKLSDAHDAILSRVGSSPETAKRADRALSGAESSISASAISQVAVQAVIVFFLVFFVLLSRDRLKDRLFEVAAPTAKSKRTVGAIIDDINRQIQRYLVVLLATAVIVGAATWAVLASQRIEHAAMWGIVAGVLNSIPYFGPMVVSGGLFVIGLSEGGLTQALQLSGAALIVTSLEGWLITPALMGKAERMSALAVFVGLVIWIWLWGEWGTILAVPMLAVIKAIADHVDTLRPVGRLLAR